MSQYMTLFTFNFMFKFYQTVFNYIVSQLKSTLLSIQINSKNLQNQFTLLPNINFNYHNQPYKSTKILKNECNWPEASQ
jgi:hypothetical protein